MSQYSVYVMPRAWEEIKDLPGRVRQRVKRAISALADNACPPGSKKLSRIECDTVVCRLRIENWRIIYRLVESDFTIDVLGVRKRPPYDYGDLAQLLNS